MTQIELQIEKYGDAYTYGYMEGYKIVNPYPNDSYNCKLFQQGKIDAQQDCKIDFTYKKSNYQTKHSS